MIRNADHTTVVGLIGHNSNLTYRGCEMTGGVMQCQQSNPECHSPLIIDNSAVEVVSSIKFLEVQISKKLECSLDISALVKHSAVSALPASDEESAPFSSITSTSY